MSSIREQLRAATNDLHREVDGLASRWDFSNRSHYCEYLVATARALCGLELALEGVGIERIFADWAVRRRRHAIERDLQSLGLPIDAAQPFAEFRSASDILGAMYVLEGSRLGARVLLKRVEPVHRAREFLSANDTALWHSFLTKLETETEDVRHAIRAARVAFLAFRGAYGAAITG